MNDPSGSILKKLTSIPATVYLHIIAERESLVKPVSQLQSPRFHVHCYTVHDILYCKRYWHNQKSYSKFMSSRLY
jgi:hypothetical protein